MLTVPGRLGLGPRAELGCQYRQVPMLDVD